MEGIKFGTQLFYSNSYDFVRKKVGQAYKENWDSIWLPDHLSGIPGGAIDDFLSLWPMFGSFAEIAKGKVLGSSVTDPHRLHPAVLAQIATTINHITDSKFILGIGAGEGMNLKAYNINSDHALTKMRESIEIMKLFWSKGKRVTYKGKYFQINKAVLLPKPIKEIPIWVAANGPKTIEMTAELGDGWIPLGLFPKVYKSGKDKILKIIERKERDFSKFIFGAFLRIYINDDESKIREQIEMTKYSLMTQPQFIKELGLWKNQFDDIFYNTTGYDNNEMSLLKIDREDIKRFDFGKLKPILEDIPNEIIRESVLIGTKEEIIKKIQKFIEAGTQYFVFEVVNGASSKNSPFTYWDVSKIISNEIIPEFI